MARRARNDDADKLSRLSVAETALGSRRAARSKLSTADGASPSATETAVFERAYQEHTAVIEQSLREVLVPLGAGKELAASVAAAIAILPDDGVRRWLIALKICCDLHAQCNVCLVRLEPYSWPKDILGFVSFVLGGWLCRLFAARSMCLYLEAFELRMRIACVGLYVAAGVRYWVGLFALAMYFGNLLYDYSTRVIDQMQSDLQELIDLKGKLDGARSGLALPDLSDQQWNALQLLFVGSFEETQAALTATKARARSAIRNLLDCRRWGQIMAGQPQQAVAGNVGGVAAGPLLTAAPEAGGAVPEGNV